MHTLSDHCNRFYSHENIGNHTRTTSIGPQEPEIRANNDEVAVEEKCEWGFIPITESTYLFVFRRPIGFIDVGAAWPTQQPTILPARVVRSGDWWLLSPSAITPIGESASFFSTLGRKKSFDGPHTPQQHAATAVMGAGGYIPTSLAGGRGIWYDSAVRETTASRRSGHHRDPFLN
jgi:hypothetical protein